MTYVASYFHAFSSMGKSFRGRSPALSLIGHMVDQAETVSRRVEKFAELMQSVWLSKNDYEARMRKLLAEIQSTLTSWSQTDFDSLPTSPTPDNPANGAAQTHSAHLRMYYALKDYSVDFASYKQTTKREWVQEKSDLAMLIGNVQTKLRTYGLREYIPPPGLSIGVSTSL